MSDKDNEILPVLKKLGIDTINHGASTGKNWI